MQISREEQKSIWSRSLRQAHFVRRSVQRVDSKIAQQEIDGRFSSKGSIHRLAWSDARDTGRMRSVCSWAADFVAGLWPRRRQPALDSKVPATGRGTRSHTMWRRRRCIGLFGDGDKLEQDALRLQRCGPSHSR